jgi:hypothetical protein
MEEKVIHSFPVLYSCREKVKRAFTEAVMLTY